MGSDSQSLKLLCTLSFPGFLSLRFNITIVFLQHLQQSSALRPSQVVQFQSCDFWPDLHGMIQDIESLTSLFLPVLQKGKPQSWDAFTLFLYYSYPILSRFFWPLFISSPYSLKARSIFSFSPHFFNQSWSYFMVSFSTLLRQCCLSILSTHSSVTAGSAPYYLILCTLHYFAGPPDLHSLLTHSYALAAQDYKGESLLNRTVLPQASQIMISQSLFHSITVADHCCISLLQLLETISKLFAWIESGPAFRLSSSNYLHHSAIFHSLYM